MFSLAEGVDKAAVFCCFLTREYEQSSEYQIELKYAKQRSLKIIPCILENTNNWKYSEWLASVIQGLETVPFDAFEDVCDVDFISQWIIYCMKKDSFLSIDIPSNIINNSSYLFEIIKYEYLQNKCIKRFMDPGKSFSIEQSYINLVIVSAIDQRKKEKQMNDILHGDAIMGAYEDIYGVKTIVHVNDIFQSCKSEKKQVLVFGRAGIGKSTFCRYITYQWAKGSFWSQYELVALIPLRHLTTERYPQHENYSLIDLVKKEVFLFELSTEEKEILKKQFDPKKTLWILDGYDEIKDNVPSHLKLLFEHLLQTPHHILTSRPYLNTLSYEVQMEITGFTDKNIEEYIDQFFTQMEDKSENETIKKESLLKFVKSKQSIWGIAYIPVNLEIICSVWSNQDLSETQNITVTNLYTTMTKWVCRRYLEAQGNNIQLLHEKKVYQSCKEELIFLESLAFRAMDANKIIIQPFLLNDVLEETNISSEDYVKILKLGFLKGFHKHTKGGHVEFEKDHYFVHLSFQEYFAARYLIRTLNEPSNEKTKTFINHQKYNQRFALVFQFMAGLVDETNSKSSIQTFWNIILGEQLDLVGIRHLQLVVQCLEETSDKSTFARRDRLLQSVADCISYHAGTDNKIVCRQLLEILKRASTVKNSDTITKIFIDLLRQSNINVTKTVLYMICRLNLSYPTVSLMVAMFTALHVYDTNVNQNTRKIFRKVVEKPVTDQVICELVTALEGDEVDRKIDACQTLDIIDEQAATDEVINKLVAALEDDEIAVRRCAHMTFLRFCSKVATNEVISKLLAALEDADIIVKIYACEALGRMGDKAATNEVISKLMIAVEDDELDVKISACFALGEIGKKVATDEVVNKLVTILGNENKRLKIFAYQILGEMGDKAATNEVISKLMSALEDEELDVKMSACIALGRIGDEAATNEVIVKLIAAFNDKDQTVRAKACETVGRMGDKAAMNEIIVKLIAAFNDEYQTVRAKACEAIVEMGTKAAMDEVISKLVIALGDQHEYVRWNACHALGNIGKKVETGELNRKLEAVLRDNNSDMRREVWKALEEVIYQQQGNTQMACTIMSREDDDAAARDRWDQCLHYVKCNNEAATNEGINKLRSILSDGKIQTYEALGNRNEETVTNEVISNLVNAFEDNNSQVIWFACEAIGRIGKIAAKNVIINKLVTALTNENESVQKSACYALERMGEKAAINEVINKLIILLKGIDFNEWYSSNISTALEKILTSLNVITQLNPETILPLCSNLHSTRILQNIYANQMIKFVLDNNADNWISVVVQFTLLFGVAVAVADNTVIVYDRQEPITLSIPSIKLRDQLVAALTDQARRLHFTDLYWDFIRN